MFSELIVIDDAVTHSAALNMAIDETLLETARCPLLRFYCWSEPSVSFGYFGRFAEARAFASGRPVVRRWTGGGIVPHGGDLTYAVIVPASAAAYVLSSREIYRRVHEAISDALRLSGIHSVLAKNDSPGISEVCFASAVLADVIEKERKIAGAAHRRTRAGLLHQGSIQKQNLDGKFRQDFAQNLAEKLAWEGMDARGIGAAEKLAREKYERDEWLRRR